MLIEAKNIPVSLDAMLPDAGRMLKREVARALGIAPARIKDLRITRKSVDARKKTNVHFVIAVVADIEDDDHTGRNALKPNKGVSVGSYEEPTSVEMPVLPDEYVAEQTRPVVIGFGPAGMFCALYLAWAGMRPIVIERGEDVDRRLRSVERFASGGQLDPESNIQFGEGGAGTFSDGKLTTGTKSPFNRFILEQFVAAGAPPDILIDAKPHIGTDYLVECVRNLRKKIIDLGGEVHFSTRFERLVFNDGNVCGVQVTPFDAQCGDDQAAHTQSVTIPTDTVVLATGHSARDVFEGLQRAGIAMERKPFACGVRIEHPQKMIDEAQYGKSYTHPSLPPADYKLAVKTDDGRGVYTFCMCPGGSVVAAASEGGGVCTNGMSNHRRDGKNANAALLVEVAPDDLDGEDVLEGVRFQCALERDAFVAAGSDYRAPAQSVGSFMGSFMGKTFASDMASLSSSSSSQASGRSEISYVQPTYPRGTKEVDLHTCLPPLITDALEDALPKLGKKIAGFDDPAAMMTAVEARSSSPVRIRRNAKTLESVSIRGLYPAGEGAGYAGGIMSAAADGLKVARTIVEACMDRIRFSDALDDLHAGRAVIFPTDTVCGIGVSVAHTQSPQVLFDLKGRPSTKPVQWLVASADALDEYCDDIPDYARALAQKFWPGGLTIVLKAAERIPSGFTSQDKTLGLRMPANETALKLIRCNGAPLAATSANASGTPPASSIDDLDEQWLASTGCSVIAGAGEEPTDGSAGSTVVDCTGSAPKILREGSIREADIAILFASCRDETDR